MRRLARLGVLVLLVLVAIAAGIVAEHPGTVTITWQGWEAETSVGVLVAALAVVAALLWVLFALIATLFRLPGRFRRNRRERRRRAGDAALARGLVALGGGDAPAALRYARRAGALLEGSTPTLLLAAQAAELAGDADETRRLYTAMLDRPRAEVLGLRGLLAQATRDGDAATAMRFAQRALAAQPKAGWAFERLLALQTQAGLWEAAGDTVADAGRRRLLPAERAAHHRGAILHQLSLMAETAGNTERALDLAATAAGLAPDLPALAGRHARLLLAQGRRRRARRAVKRAWRRLPHPELAAIWDRIGDSEPLAKVGWMQRLASLNPGSRESDLCVAEAALAAQLWGVARDALTRAVGASGPGGPPRRVCLMMARLEQGEYAQTGAARDWIDRAVAAPPDPAYLCDHCGGESTDWQPLCPHCRSFDALGWREQPPGSLAVPPPLRVVTAAPLPPPRSLAAAEQSDK